MKNLEMQRETFMREPWNKRLTHLATSLQKIDLFSIDDKQKEAVREVIEQSRWYIEWTAREVCEVNVENAAELVDVARELTSWLFDWDNHWNDSKNREIMRQQAKAWSERVFKMSQLLYHAEPDVGKVAEPKP